MSGEFRQTEYGDCPSQMQPAFSPPRVRIPRPDRSSLIVLGEAYAKAGRSAGIRQVLALLLKTSDVSQALITRMYLIRGESEQAIRWYEKAFDERDPFVVWIRWTPQESLVWKDPRFQNLVHRMNSTQ